MLTPQPGREVALGSDRRRIGLAPRGAIEIVPAGIDLLARWFTEKENMLFLFDPASLRDLAEAETGHGEVECHPPAIGTTDEVALQFALMARREFLLGDAANDLCLDSLSLLLSIHLIRAHSSLGAPPKAPRGGLSPRGLRTVTDFIEANLQERLSVTRLAEVAGLSPGHFLRAFRTSVG
jgi:AraC family transcriptional regulator